MISFSVLASGSRANCVYVTSGNTRVLVDCGLSCKQIEQRLSHLSVHASQIDALVITHEHCDHVAGIRVFAQRYGVAVYVNRQTYKASPEMQYISSERLRFFESGTPFMVSELEFDPFSIDHDAEDPVAFRISAEDRTLGIVTDLGHVTELVRERTRGLDAIVLESNHDVTMLQECKYPWSLKQRISGNKGHLSNDTAGELLSQVLLSGKNVQFAVAAHISENSNLPELALKTFDEGVRRSGIGIKPATAAAGAAAATQLFQLV